MTRALLSRLVGLLEDVGLSLGGAVGGDGADEGGLDLRRRVREFAVDHGVEEGGGALAEQRAVPVQPRVRQRRLEAGVAAEEGGAAVAEDVPDVAHRPQNGGYDLRVRSPVPAIGN